jgi:hypothetical protein
LAQVALVVPTFLTLKEVGKKEWTGRTYLMSLKGFSRWLNVNGYLKTDPGAPFKAPRLKRHSPVLPPFEEMEAHLMAEPSWRNKAIIATAASGRTYLPRGATPPTEILSTERPWQPESGA